MVSQVILLRVQYLVIIISLLFSLKETAASSAAKPGCPETCGNVAIVYPFGIGEGCYLDKRFEISCRNSSNPRPALHFHRQKEVEVLDMSLEHVRIRDWTSPLCYARYAVEGKSYIQFSSTPSIEPFSYSHSENMLIGIGCDIFAYIGDSLSTNSSIKNFISGCVSVCNGQGWSWIDTNYSCSGIGCCRTAFPYDLYNFYLRLGNMSIGQEAWHPSGFHGCSIVFIAENNFSEFHQLDISFSNRRRKYFYPVVLKWDIIGNKSCHKSPRERDNLCGINSHCVNSSRGSGYKCVCNPGYRGNPYLPDGCKDVDECMESYENLCQKGAVCSNTEGSYYCGCSPGYHRDDDNPENECIHNKEKLKEALLVSSGMGVTLVILVLLATGFWLKRELEKRKKRKLREKFFKKNGGLLMQKQISSSSIESSVEKTKLYSIEELEKATDNFNTSRLLGKGGRGRVYKGMLLDGRIVAIKKSIVVDERQVAEFINEVFILSQISQRHIVKLLGCCLESEVPMLVYEYVSNNTLSHHLHNVDDAPTLSWETRLRIAAEIAGALAYLHSYASTAILHRDVKSRNILLDESFRAVLSDFGLSRSIPDEQTHLSTLVQGTFGYLDPEYFRTGKLTDRSDVYGFGMILAELLTGEKVICSSRSEESLAVHFRSAMKHNCLFEILDEVIVNEGTKKEIISVARIANRCLKLSGKKRPTMKEIEADLYLLRRTTDQQPSLQETCQDNCSLSLSYSLSSASTSCAVTEDFALQG